MKKILVLLTVSCFVLVGCGKSNISGSVDKASVDAVTEACSEEMVATYQNLENSVNSLSPCLNGGNYCSDPTVTYLKNWVSAFKNNHGEAYGCVATIVDDYSGQTSTEIYNTTDFDELLSQMAANTTYTTPH